MVYVMSLLYQECPNAAFCLEYTFYFIWQVQTDRSTATYTK